MKRILYAKIVIAFGYMFFGFYAEADQSKALEVKEDITSEKQVLSMTQVSDMKSNKAERNGFVTVSLTPSCSFSIDPSSSECIFDLDLATSYGVVFGKSALADAGILEGKVGIYGEYSSYFWNAGVQFGIDINFIKNNGINKMIPGLFLGTGISYNEWNDRSLIIGGLALGAMLKVFVSKQLAVIPDVGVLYSHDYIVMESSSKDKHANFLELNKVKINLSLGLRYYF